MLLRRIDRSRRRGATLVEGAIVLPVLCLLLLGTVVGGQGVYLYEQVAALAREGARYASVHGTDYAKDTGQAAADQTAILNNAIIPKAAGLDTSLLTCTVTWNTSNQPVIADPSSSSGKPINNTVRVTVNYQWNSILYFGNITLTSTSEMPMCY